MIKFRVGDTRLKTAQLETEIPDENESVLAVGHPGGQYNSVTFGNIIDYDEIASKTEDKELGKVMIDVLWHTAHIEKGSSGGALYNAELKIIGLNYASSVNENDEFQYGFSIPGKIIAEFIEDVFSQNAK